MRDAATNARGASVAGWRGGAHGTSRSTSRRRAEKRGGDSRADSCYAAWSYGESKELEPLRSQSLFPRPSRRAEEPPLPSQPYPTAAEVNDSQNSSNRDECWSLNDKRDGHWCRKCDTAP